MNEKKRRLFRGVLVFGFSIVLISCGLPRLYRTYVSPQFDFFGVDLDKSEFGVQVSMYPPQNGWREIGWKQFKHTAGATYVMIDPREGGMVDDELYAQTEIASFEIVDGSWDIDVPTQQAMVDSIARMAHMMGGGPGSGSTGECRF